MRLFKNSMMGALQALLTSVSLFLLYYYLLRTVGAAGLGLWSLLMAVVAIGRIGEFGMPAGIVRFIARDIAAGQPGRASANVQFALIAVAVLLGLVLVFAAPVVKWLLRFILPASQFEAVVPLLPMTLLGLWLGSLATVMFGAIDGCGRSDLRGIVVIAASLVQVVATTVFVPHLQLMGIVYGYLAQSLTALCLACYLNLRLMPSVLQFRNISAATPREIFSFGAILQLNLLLQLLFDPLTKALIGRYDSVSSVAIFEMANRMILQVRSLLIGANEATVPFFAAWNRSLVSRQALLNAYSKRFNANRLASLPVYIGIVALAPSVSEFWIGKLDYQFVLLCWLLAPCWLVNTLVAPAYFANIALGNVRRNVISHVLIGVTIVSIGAPLATLFGATGVVIAYSTALLLGSAYIPGDFARLTAGEHRPWKRDPVFIGSIGAAVLVLGSHAVMTGWTAWSPALKLVVCMMAYAAVVCWTAYHHPVAADFLGRFARAMRRHPSNHSSRSE